jgi:hypothetical protein
MKNRPKDEKSPKRWKIAQKIKNRPKDEKSPKRWKIAQKMKNRPIWSPCLRAREKRISVANKSSQNFDRITAIDKMEHFRYLRTHVIRQATQPNFLCTSVEEKQPDF